MSDEITLNSIFAVALCVQILIFAYLYSSNRVRFFRYLIFAWVFYLARVTLAWPGRYFPVVVNPPLISLVGQVGDLFILAAGLAYRRDYKIRWRDAALGAIYAVVLLLGSNLFAGKLALAILGLLKGAPLIAGGLMFWPGSSPARHRGGRFLAASLALWGLQRAVAFGLGPSSASGGSPAINLPFVFFYFLTVLAIVIVVLDRARGEIASLKEINERLVEGLGAGLQLVDGAFKVHHTNRWMAQQFGQGVGKRCYEVITRDAQPCPGCPLQDRQRLKGPVRLEVFGRDDRCFLITCSAVRQHDREVFLLELVNDITEQEQLRVRLTESERLADAGELAVGVAHEIRNPLAAIINATSLLERRENLSTNDRQATIEAIRKEGRRLNLILSDFLSFARPREPRRVRNDLGEVVNHVATLLREDRDRTRGVSVEVSAEPTVPVFAFDSDQLTQVIWNIALNGVEAMEGKGTLRLDVWGQNGEAFITIRDSGPGIPADEHGRVFLPFFSKKRSGTGLGLAIARRIVTAHGGRIDLESATGQGSRFKICLPIVPE